MTTQMVVSEDYSVRRTREMVAEMRAAGHRCDAKDHISIGAAYARWKWERDNGRVDRTDTGGVDLGLAGERLRGMLAHADAAEPDLSDPVREQDVDPLEALQLRRQAQAEAAWRTPRRGSAKQYGQRADYGPGVFGSSPDAEDEEPPPGKDDDSLPRNANRKKRGVDPMSARSPDVSVGAPRVPREATEHGRSAFGNGNEGDNSGDFALPPWSSDDDDGATKMAQDAMFQKAKDAWRTPKRARP